MSKLPFELFLALRYLRPKRTFVSIITLISVTGVALGVAVLIIVISVMSGYDRELREKILGFDPHIIVTANGTTMTNYSQVAEIISSNKNVRAVSPFVLGPVLVETEGDTNRPALQDAPMMRGVDADVENKISKLPSEIIAGKFDLTGHGIVVGVDFANNMNLQIGDHLSILSKSQIQKMRAAHDQKQDEVIAPDDYEVRGIFSTGYYDYDGRFVLVSLENAQDLYDLDDSVHGLFVMLNDPYQAPKVAAELQKTLGNNFNFLTWMQKNSAFLGALVVEKNLMFYIMFFIVVVAAFGITCTLVTFVMMKTREIGLLKAVGATNRQVMFVFVAQSLVISLFGIAVGLSLGLFGVFIRNDFLHLMNRLSGYELFPASIYQFSELPAVIIPHDIAIICGGSLVICLIAAILPARHASKMKTVQALHHE
jgi:lipoprotein-releasing system permease protein